MMRLGRQALLGQEPQKQTFGRLGIPMDLDDLIKDITVLIDSAPEIALLAPDRDDHFVEVPDVVPAPPFAFQASRISRAELQRPASDSLIGNHDAAFQQHFLNQAQAQRKAEIQPHRMGDGLGRETMALVADRRLAHPADIGHDPLRRS